MKQEKARTITISISSEFYDKLEDMAKKEKKSKSYFIREAINNYLKNLDSMVLSSNGKWISLANFKKSLKA